MATSDKRIQSLTVGCASEPHQALEAYVSLEIITDRYMVCNDESSIPCARNTLKAYRACAQELMMRCVCSETDRLLVKVTPRILITVTRLIFGSGRGGSYLVLLRYAGIQACRTHEWAPFERSAKLWAVRPAMPRYDTDVRTRRRRNL